MLQYAEEHGELAEFRESKYKRKSSLDIAKMKEIIDRKKKRIQRDFKIGDAPEAGEIEELIIHGKSVLENELEHAWSIPEDQRVMVR